MIAEYKKNKKAVENLEDQLEKKINSRDEVIRKVQGRYYELLHKLEEEKKKEIALINGDLEKEESKIREAITEHSKVINQVKRVLALKGISKKTVDLSFELIYLLK